MKMLGPATFSSDLLYRYDLQRDVAPETGEGTVAFIGLNRSTPTQYKNDRTVSRCIGFAKDWGTPAW
jgi:hypothetical protein